MMDAITPNFANMSFEEFFDRTTFFFIFFKVFRIYIHSAPLHRLIASRASTYNRIDSVRDAIYLYGPTQIISCLTRFPTD